MSSIIIRSFQDRREIDLEFFFASEIDHVSTLRSVTWVDRRARSSYLRFSDLIVFDTK